MKYLILIDTKFPYRKGESFLESEIAEDSKFFDKILIFPIDVFKGENVTRSISEKNVCFYTFDNKYGKIRYGFASIFDFFKQKSKSIKNKYLDSYFESRSICQSKKIIKILNSIKFDKNDSVVIYSYWFYVTARIGVELNDYFKRNNIKVKFISRAHRFDIYDNGKNDKYLPQRKLLLQNVDKVYACSYNGSKYMKENYPEYSGKISTSFLGTYDHGCGILPAGKIFNLLSCSRVTSIKRVSLIADAVSLLESRGYIINWTHIGDGPQMEDLKKSVEKIKLSSVNLLGSIPNKCVYDFYENNAVNLFINVSSSEGLPVSIMEAISYSVPVVATDVGGTNEIVCDKTGMLLSSDCTTEEVANSIEYIIKMDNTVYSELRTTTRKYWEENFEAKKNYSHFAEEISTF